MVKFLLQLFAKQGISKGTRFAKALGFKSKDITKASKEYVRIYRSEPGYFPTKNVYGLKGKRHIGGGGASEGRVGGMPDHAWFSSHKHRDYAFNWKGAQGPGGRVYQFKVPKSYIEKAKTRQIPITKLGKNLKEGTLKQLPTYGEMGGVFKGGIPTRFLENVYFRTHPYFKSMTQGKQSRLQQLLERLFGISNKRYGPGY